MENILFKIIGDGMINDELAQTVKDKLFEKYQKSFTITNLGRRLGTPNNDTVTAFCYEDTNENLKFTCILNRDRVHFEDDFCLRNICYELKCAFAEKFEKLKIQAFQKINIIGKNKYDEIVPLQEFINKEKNVNFLVEIFTDNDISDTDFRNISNIIKDKYKNIKLRLIIYVFNKNEYYKELIDEIKEFPDTEDLEIDEENLNNKLELKIIENNLII